MFENIITNAIETPRGYKNPGHEVALRGPLSQFFSAVYLKPLDDAFNKMDVTYVRYQDDIIILCKTKRQLNRAKRRMMEILRERRLSLSRKKSRMGCIQNGFHFLGIDYSGTRPQDNTNVGHSNDDKMFGSVENSLTFMGGGGEVTIEQLKNVPIRIVPHARTLRNARVQVKAMVASGFSVQMIRTYLKQWARWWVTTSEVWQYEALLEWFVRACWDLPPAAIAVGLLKKSTASHTRPSSDCLAAA